LAGLFGLVRVNNVKAIVDRFDCFNRGGLLLMGFLQKRHTNGQQLERAV